ncbi:hypothetical protein DNTS_013413 [Danionella cerebrum]|uniref:Selenoprotein S n=1 Tax=Danionella cerebrum TaxID=2873325 RepID=A0A553MX86_9TELE|nr:hypothetical protein DNTS_012043 [Danionella translucida]TRY84281.1 hypothetical protein DNTS_013413 [Danionella translucida]
MEGDVGAEIRNEGVLPENQDLSFLQPLVMEFLSEYGWYLLFVCVGVCLFIQHLRKSRNTNASSSSEAGTNHDPVSIVRHQEALEASRRRMQEEQDARAAEFREKQLRLEEEKRRQKIEMWESTKEGKSYKRSVKLAEATAHCLEMEEERAPGDLAGEAHLLEDEVKDGQTTSDLRLLVDSLSLSRY